MLACRCVHSITKCTAPSKFRGVHFFHPRLRKGSRDPHYNMRPAHADPRAIYSILAVQLFRAGAKLYWKLLYIRISCQGRCLRYRYQRQDYLIGELDTLSATDREPRRKLLFDPLGFSPICFFQYFPMRNVYYPQ